MATPNFLLLVLGALVFVQHSAQNCQQAAAVPLAESFYFPTVPREWFVPLSEKPTRAKAAKGLTSGRTSIEITGLKTVCITVSVDSSFISGTFKAECSFDEPGQLSCSGSAQDDLKPLFLRPMLPKYGTGVNVKTDNSTYATFVVCVEGLISTWFVASSLPQLDEKLQNDILDHMDTLGMDTTNEQEDGFDVTMIDSGIEKGGC